MAVTIQDSYEKNLFYEDWIGFFDWYILNVFYSVYSSSYTDWKILFHIKYSVSDKLIFSCSIPAHINSFSDINSNSDMSGKLTKSTNTVKVVTIFCKMFYETYISL